jgi:hypothetical protein
MGCMVGLLSAWSARYNAVNNASNHRIEGSLPELASKYRAFAQKEMVKTSKTKKPARALVGNTLDGENIVGLFRIGS